MARKKNQISFQRVAVLTVTVIAIPLFLSVLIFVLYTLQTNRRQILNARENTLSIYRSQLEDTLQTTEDYLTDTVINDIDFQMIIYANTRTDAYLATQEVADKCKALLRMHELLGTLSIYSEQFDCYRLVYETSYPVPDLVSLRTAVQAAAQNKDGAQRWIPFPFSDRTVLLYLYTHHGTVFAAMVDPSRQTHSVSDENSRIFYIQHDGTPYVSSDVFDMGSISVPDGTKTTYLKDGDTRYQLVGLPLSGENGFIVYASPSLSLMGQLNAIQKLLLFITLCLLLFIPCSWLLLRRVFLIPVGRLTTTMRAIEQGDQSVRVPQDSMISEVSEISGTVNTMLDTIRQQKIDSYEQQLETQYAQLQYLQLQIRPHFFLSCLNLIYSMAEEGKITELQELTLDLSTYLRSIFKDSKQKIPLSTELCSVKSYLRIQQTGTQFPPQLDLSVDAVVSQTLIPPLSLLTFVENSVKHSKRINSPLRIHIRCCLLRSTDGEYLNVTISDNGGGVSAEQLTALNRLDKRVYTDHHVGISNIRHRLRLLFGDQATLCFRNVPDGLCVELFLPVEKEINKGDDLYDSSVSG